MCRRWRCGRSETHRTETDYSCSRSRRGGCFGARLSGRTRPFAEPFQELIEHLSVECAPRRPGNDLVEGSATQHHSEQVPEFGPDMDAFNIELDGVEPTESAT